jgi:hypothetical protein
MFRLQGKGSALADSYAAFTKQQKAFSLPLMPRLAVTFANHGKSNQKRFGERRQNHSAHVQCTATTISLKTTPLTRVSASLAPRSKQ